MHRILATTAAILVTATAASAMKGTDLDINADGFATLDEVRTIIPGFTSSDFRRLDGNDDRRLSAAELNAAGVQETLGKYADTMAVVHGLSDIDRNGDRFASVEELRAVYPGLQDVEFQRIDGNRDNRVSAAELYKPLAQALVTRYEMGGEDITTIMSVDTDDDAFASFDELKAAFPGISQLDFEMIDLNGDNRVASREFYDPASQAILDRN